MLQYNRYVWIAFSFSYRFW